MNICDSCGKPSPVHRLMRQVVLNGVRRLIAVTYISVIPSDDSFHLCRSCLIEMIVEGKDAKDSKIGFGQPE